MKQFIKEHKKELAIATGFGLIGLLTGLYFGRRNGKDELIEVLIHKDMCGNTDWPVYMSDDKRFGNLMFEIKAECIGD